MRLGKGEGSLEQNALWLRESEIFHGEIKSPNSWLGECESTFTLLKTQNSPAEKLTLEKRGPGLVSALKPLAGDFRVTDCHTHAHISPY